MENFYTKKNEILIKTMRGIKSIVENKIKGSNKKRYTLIVSNNLIKTELKLAIENIFEIEVIKINTSNLPIKYKKVNKIIGIRPNYKKVTITLKEGDILIKKD